MHATPSFALCAQADVILPSSGGVPIMAHPPATESDLTLEHFLHLTGEHNANHPDRAVGEGCPGLINNAERAHTQASHDPKLDCSCARTGARTHVLHTRTHARRNPSLLHPPQPNSTHAQISLTVSTPTTHSSDPTVPHHTHTTSSTTSHSWHTQPSSSTLRTPTQLSPALFFSQHRCTGGAPADLPRLKKRTTSTTTTTTTTSTLMRTRALEWQARRPSGSTRMFL
jgi:hypothetical protein